MRQNATFFSFLFLSFIAASCSKEDFWDCFVEKKTYYFYENKALAIEYLDSAATRLKSFEIVEGEKLVFEYNRAVERGPDCECFDCAEGDWLYFEIDKDLTSFTMETEELATANVLWLSLFGFCGCVYNKQIEEGFIKGKKLNETEWRVEVNLKEKFSDELKFKKTFTLKD